MTKDLAVPTVHLNGSGARLLMDQYSKALVALRAAKEALSNTAPHMRDYYVQREPGGYDKARSEHIVRLACLEQVEDELQLLAAKVYEQEHW